MSFYKIDQSLMSQKWFDYVDAEYLFDLQKARSQMNYLLTYGGTTIFWHSTNIGNHFFKSWRNNIDLWSKLGCVWLKSWSIIFRKYVIFHPPYTRIIYNSIEVRIQSKEIGQSIVHQKSFTHDLQQNGDIDVQSLIQLIIL